MQPDGRLPTPLPDTPSPDVARLTETLDRHGVDYLVIGGIATRAYGAERPTGDFDCLVRRSAENFDRLAAAMRELNARLRVGGLSDDEAAALPVQLDGLTLSRSQISTWSTDAGYLDVLVDMVNRQGHRQRYEDLEGAAEVLTVAGVQVRVAGLEDIIDSKEHAGRPKDDEALPELYEPAP